MLECKIALANWKFLRDPVGLCKIVMLRVTVKFKKCLEECWNSWVHVFKFWKCIGVESLEFMYSNSGKASVPKNCIFWFLKVYFNELCFTLIYMLVSTWSCKSNALICIDPSQLNSIDVQMGWKNDWIQNQK